LKLRTAVFVSVLFLSFIPTSIADDNPPTPPPSPAYFKYFSVNPTQIYINGTLDFWCQYFDPENRTITSAKVYIESFSYDLFENDSAFPNIGKNYTWNNGMTVWWSERRTYEFYFQIVAEGMITNSSVGIFEVVNRVPYMLEPPPVKIYVNVLFEWWGRAFDPDLDKLHWKLNTSIKGSQVIEFEHEVDGERYHIKIKCKESFQEWINLTVWETFGGLDYWNRTLICYDTGEGQGEPSPPRSGVGRTPLLPIGISETSTRSEFDPTPLADDPPTPLATKTWNGGGLTDDYFLDLNPNAAGNDAAWSIGAGCANNWDCVNEGNGSEDDGTSYVYTTSSNSIDSHHIDDHTTETGTIVNVRWSVYGRNNGGNEEIDTYLEINGVGAETADINCAPGGWTTCSENYAQNPMNTTAWSWADIDGLMIGYKSSNVGGFGGQLEVSTVYITVTYTATPDELWSTAGNWNPNGVPANGDDVVFDNSNTNGCTIDVNTNDLESFLMDTGYTGTVTLGANTLDVTNTIDTSSFTGTQGTFNAGTGTVQVGGSMTISSGTFTFTDGTSTVDLTGTGNLASKSGNNFFDLDAGGPAETTTITTDITVDNTLTIGTGTFTKSAAEYVDLTAQNGQLVNGGTLSAHVSYSFGGNTDIQSTTYGGILWLKLGLDNAIATMQGGVTVSSHLYIYNEVVAETVVLKTGGNSLTVSGTTRLGHTDGTKLGVMDCDAASIDVVAVDINGNSYITGDDSIWTVSGDWDSESTSGSMNLGGSLVTFDNAGNQNIDHNDDAFHNVVIAGTGTKTLTDDLTINRVWITSTLTQNAATVLTMIDKGNITNNGTFNINGGLTRSGVDWWHFFSTGTVNTLNSAVIIYVAIARPLTYTIAASTNTTTENISVVSPAGATTNQIAWVDWADIDTVGDRFLIMNTTQVAGIVEYTISNLTATNDYEVYVDDVKDTTLTADASGDIYWTYNGWSVKEIEFGAAAPAAPVTVWYWSGLVDGDWDDAGNWEPQSGADYPKSNADLAYIDGADVITLQDGANTEITIGELFINNTFTGTLSMSIDLILDHAGARNGKFTMGAGTLTSGVGNSDIYIDGDWQIDGGTFTANSNRVIFQGAASQNVKSSGNAFYQVTVDNVAGTILYVKDDIQMLDLTILANGKFEMDPATEGVALTCKFNDAASPGIISSSSGTFEITGDGVNGATLTTADAAPPPTNYWTLDGSSITVTMDYVTVSYHTMGWATAFTGTIDIEDSTFTLSKASGQPNVAIRTSSVTKFDDNTISNSGALGLYVTTQDITNINNLVITASTSSDITAVTQRVELADSNFDASKVSLQTGGDVISNNHNDVANAYGIWATDFLKSAITNDFATGDDVRLYSGKFMMNENGAADTVRFDSGTTFQIGQDSPTGSRTLTFDDTAGSGFDINSAGTLIGSGTVANGQIITSAATPPTNYWSGDMSTGDPAITMDYTTLNYGTLMNTGGTWDVDDCTFDNFENTAYAVEIETGSTITSFTDNTISNAGFGLDVQVAYTSFDNIVISGMSNTEIRANDVDIEFTNSNFDVTQTDLATTGNIFSDTHDDVANNYKIICTNADKSGITNDFGAGDNVEVVSNGCLFTIDEDAESTNFWLQANTVVTHDTLTLWTITGNANFTVNGSFESSGVISYSGASWYVFFVNYDAQVWLNSSTVDYADIVISHPYSIAASNYGAVNELNITQPAGADNSVNITQRDFSVKDSGTVITFFSNNSKSVTTHYTVTNLTNGNAYDFKVNGTTIETLNAASGQIGFTYTSDGIQELSISYSANVTGEHKPPVGKGHLYVDIEIQSIDYRTFDLHADVDGTDPRFFFEWDFGDGSHSKERNPNHQYDIGFVLWKDYDVKLSVEDSKNRKAEAETTIRIINWPVIIFLAMTISISLIAAIILIRRS
jgi:hypothetical protein